MKGVLAAAEIAKFDTKGKEKKENVGESLKVKKQDGMSSSSSESKPTSTTKSEFSGPASTAIATSGAIPPEEDDCAKGACAQTPSKKQGNIHLVDQIRGVIYGNCIGDAIGLLTEFMNKDMAQKVVKCIFNLL